MIRKLLCLIVFCMMTTVCANAEQTLVDTLEGEWHLNDKSTLFGGKMSIFSCSDSVCKFNIQSWYDSHICDVDGELSIQSGFAEYKTTKYVYDYQTDAEYYIPVGIVFNVLSQNKLNLRYINTDSDNVFCGMNATIEGVWIKQ